MNKSEFLAIAQATNEELTRRCFTAWRDGKRLDSTVKGHCLKYFREDDRLTASINNRAKMMGLSKNGRRLLLTIYRGILKAQTHMFRSYSDEDVEKIYHGFLAIKFPSTIAEND